MDAAKPEKKATKEQVLSYLYPKQFECAVCEKTFSDHIVRKTKLKNTGTDTDLLARFADIDPNHYEVLFCPNCGYAALHSYFDKIVNVQRMRIKEKITPKFTPVEFVMPLSMEQVIQRYKQALLCATAMEAKVSQKALICLKMAWVLRVAGVKELEMRFIKDALAGLKEAYTTERFPLGNMDESTAKYLIADLMRRTGDLTESMRWVGELITSRSASPGLRDKADRLKDMIRDGITD
jgi:uncharacterized protein (DUF2225 family)